MRLSTSLLLLPFSVALGAALPLEKRIVGLVKSDITNLNSKIASIYSTSAQLVSYDAPYQAQLTVESLTGSSTWARYGTSDTQSTGTFTPADTGAIYASIGGITGAVTSGLNELVLAKQHLINQGFESRAATALSALKTDLHTFLGALASASGSPSYQGQFLGLQYNVDQAFVGIVI